MYSESEVQSAVEAGAISPAAAAALRDHVAALRRAPAVDEEQFRLVTGFNDIFVTIACLLVVFAAAAVGATVAGAASAGLLVAAAAWGMAEVFTRRRRMALPSIILLLTFVTAIGSVAAIACAALLGGGDGGQRQIAAIMLAGAAGAGLAALLHWRRFRVPITIAAAIGALVLFVLALVGTIRGDASDDAAVIAAVALVCGIGVFAYAMWWDMSDRARTTQRSDVAFWLHLVAAPLIAHPLFYWIGVTRGEGIGVGGAIGVLAVYLLFAVVALAVDRRALLVSALAYVLAAMAQLFRSYGAIELNVALTALVIGSALLCLSAWWHAIRVRLLALLPPDWRARLPVGGLTVGTRPADG
ncbi:hypothetical protein [Sphingomonas sp.]|uniref:hypothetical protein n=1 Tax=Sphingomonas sp. TaxID=28214 RepID=UPI0035C82466